MNSERLQAEAPPEDFGVQTWGTGVGLLSYTALISSPRGPPVSAVVVSWCFIGVARTSDVCAVRRSPLVQSRRQREKTRENPDSSEPSANFCIQKTRAGIFQHLQVFTPLEYGMCGLNEEQCKEKCPQKIAIRVHHIMLARGHEAKSGPKTCRPQRPLEAGFSRYGEDGYTSYTKERNGSATSCASLGRGVCFAHARPRACAQFTLRKGGFHSSNTKQDPKLYIVQVR